jgi:hypothetical protein
MNARTIICLIRIASCLLGGVVALGVSTPGLAQGFSTTDLAMRRVTVTEYQGANIVANWPWKNMASYDRAVMMIPMDPVLPMAGRAAVIHGPHRLVMTEKSAEGDVVREITVVPGAYRFRYILAAATWVATPPDMISFLQQRIVAPGPGQSLPPLLVRGPGLSGGIIAQGDLRAIKNFLDQARPLSLSERQRLPLHIPPTQSITMIPGASLTDWPDRIVIGPQAIQLVEYQAHSLMFMDRQNWWGRAMAERH